MSNSVSLPVLKFPHITLAAQNCNSLNISTKCDKQLTKIVAITSLCSNIIFLSDIRMGCSAEHSEKISKMFLTNSTKKYQFIFNSSKSSRGVGMLIDNSLSSLVQHIFKCPSENILGVKLLIDGSPILLISIYGPNDNDISFYLNLSALIADNPGVPVIVGGDWNTTYSTSDPNRNPDVLYMKTIPSKMRSGWLNDLCIELELSDPFRAFHPTKRDFTFIPRGNKKNRSRLDFFLISNSIIPFVQRCDIASSNSISLFDHKPTFLDFTKDKASSKLFINRSILNNPRTDDVVLAAVADTYLSHAAADQPPGVLEDGYVFHPGIHDPLASQKLEVGKFIKLCKEYNALIERQVHEKNSNLLNLLIAEKETEINLQRVKI